MGDHPNAATYRALFARDETSAMRESLAEDVVWNQIGGDPVHGADAVMEMMSVSDGVEFNLDLHDVISNDDHMIALMNVTIGSGADAFNYRTAEIYHVKDGKITERWAFSDDTGRISEFFAQFA